MRLEGRTALVTGGASGIGAATCRRLAAEGAHVAVTDLNLESASELAGEIAGDAYELDVRSTESIGKAVEAIGPVDVLVNNAGYDEFAFFTQTDEALWDRVLAVNLRGVLAVTHAVLPGMQERRRGRIVNVASEAGRVGSHGSSAYSAAKGGVIGFTEVIATDDKVRLVEMLARAGVPRLEVTSFVRPDVIPQLADGAEVLRRARIPDGVAVTVLIPNERGLDNALKLREHFQEVNLFLSASETHNRKNVNRSIEESLAGLERVVERARADGLRCEGVISVAFGCPYEGDVPRERVFAIARRLVEAGCEEGAFGDTTGMANPRQVGEFFAEG